MNEFTKQVIYHSVAWRFPGATWERLKNLVDKYHAGEISAETLNSKVFSITEYYDNIKDYERWWCKDNAISIPLDGCQNYGVKEVIHK